MPLVVPVMSQRQIWASSEPESRWPSKKGLQASPYLEHTQKVQRGLFTVLWLTVLSNETVYAVDAL